LIWLLLIVLLGVASPQSIVEENPATEPSTGDVLQFLGKTIDWYRQVQQEQRIATEPGDLAFAADNHRLADQIVKLAFDFARQEEQQLAKQSKGKASVTTSEVGSRYENLVKAAANADRLVQQAQAQLQSLKQQLDKAPASKRGYVETQIDEVESELGLFQARQQALHSLLDFAGGATKSGGAMGFRSQIEEFAHAVPAALSGATGGNDTANPTQQQTTQINNAVTRSNPTGIWGLTADLFRLSGKRSALTQDLRATQALSQESKQLRTPLVAHLRQLIHTGDEVSKQADIADEATLIQQKQQLDALTVEFKQVSSLLSFLGKQNILLELYQRSLTNWQGEVTTDLKDRLRSLLIRVVGVAIALGAVLLVGEFWRRAIFRYVHDIRRRYQFLLMRRIAVWCGFALVLMFAFVTELGAVATFAGLITAGVAVALQNVIVSIVGYFFLIGKFGIRVGDRVQVGNVTGEVVDIGLVRFHLMELGGSGADSEPTGRVVAFSNSVVFQATGGLFKQIPGTSFVWREITLKFSTDSDHPLIRERLQKAIDHIFADYTDALERQRRQMEMSLTSIPSSDLRPRVRIHFTTAATEAIVRYPVMIDKAAEIDERVIGEVFSAIASEPKIKLIDSVISSLKTGS
jgi:small-conductance mechanosensitive channel